MLHTDFEELKRAFDKFRSLPFPEDSENDEVSQLHAELAEYDGFVAGLVATLLQGDDMSPHLRFDNELEDRLARIARWGGPTARADARKHLEYLGALKNLIDTANGRTPATTGTYRRRRGQDTWHICRNCSNWPTSGYDTRSSRPTTGELCNECQSKRRMANCW
jgi:hypothetical protein